MAGYIRQDTTNNIADGNVINASDLDNEYNAIEGAFNSSTGHTHDGTSAEGAPITKIGPTQDVVASAGALTPKTDNTVDLGSSSFEYKDLWIDGTANIDSLVADTADINGGTIDGTRITPRVVALTDASSVTFNGDTTDIATQANTQIAGTLTINAPTGTPANGQKLIFRLRSTNVQTFSWNAAFEGSSDLGLPTASSGSSKYDYMGFIYNSTASKWQMVAKIFGF